MECPKCGRAVDDGAFICPGCDFILDATFLGDDITDDERDARPGRTLDGLSKKNPADRAKPAEPQPDFGEDAMILGDVHQIDEVSSFNSKDAGVSQREATQARFYFGGVVAQLMMPDAIPEPGAGVSGVSIRMTPFERHVLGFVNGRRSVARIQKKSAMDEAEFKTALAMLADKGFIRLKGWKKQKDKPATAATSSERPGNVGIGQHVGGRTGSGSASRPSSALPRTSTAPVLTQPPAERTVVASMEHIEALAKAAADLARGKITPSVPSAAAPSISPQVSSQLSTSSTVVTSSLPSPPATRIVPAQSSLRITPPHDASREQATVVGPSPIVVASRRFASLQAEPPPNSSVPDVVASADVADGADADADEARDPLAAAAAADWDANDNQSSVFADVPATQGFVDTTALASEPAPSAPPLPAPRVHKPLAATRPTGHFPVDDHDDDVADELPPPAPVAQPDDDVVGDPDGFDDGYTGDGLAALRDPTGMGDSVMASDGGAAHGAPIHDDDAEYFDADDDNDGDGDDGDDGDGDDGDEDAWADAEPDEAAGTFADDADDDHGDDADIDDDLLGPPRRVHDERTSAPAIPPRVDTFGKVTVGPDAPIPAVVDDDDFDLEPPKTSIKPRPLTLAPSALSPVERTPPPAPAPPPVRPVTAPLPLPRVVTPAPTPPAPPAPPAPAPTLLALPGQDLVNSATMPLPVMPPASSSMQGPSTLQPAPVASVAGALGANRVSAASSVPFELRKKAERIYEQALKDQAEGRLSSALMNAKLAMNFDGSVPAYKALFEQLNTAKASPQGPRPRELVLFEQASEAEGKGDHLRAVKLLEEAIAVNPRAAALYNRIGVVLSIRLKRHDEALMHLKKAIELEPGSIVYMNNFSKVTGLLESMLDKDPKKKKGQLDDAKVGVKKLRPKMF